jgi:signal transduction histidine kinase
VIGRSTQELSLWVDPRDQDRLIRTLRAEGSVHNMECDFRIKSGEIRNTQVSAGIMDIAGEMYMLAVVRDITQRKQAESALQQARDELELRVQGRTSELDRANRALLEEIEQHHRTERALQESERQLRLLSTRLLAAQEDERKHVAKEIHDSIGQILAAIKFGMERVAGDLPAGVGPEVGAAIRNLAAQVRGAIEEVRRIQMALRPALLDDLGVLATISWFCREYQAVYTDMQIEQRISLGEDDIPQPLKIVIFRVMQEALNNAAKHSGASVVRLSLSRTDQALEFAVQDFGKGFEWLPSIRFPKSDGGMGLLSMKERTELSGGSFLIESSPGSGTKILAKWPASGSTREGWAAS